MVPTEYEYFDVIGHVWLLSMSEGMLSHSGGAQLRPELAGEGRGRGGVREWGSGRL